MFFGAGVLFRPCPSQARPEKTLQENKPLIVYNLLTNISSILSQVNSARAFAAFRTPGMTVQGKFPYHFYYYLNATYGIIAKLSRLLSSNPKRASFS
jgi:hypothetical protein